MRAVSYSRWQGICSFLELSEAIADRLLNLSISIYYYLYLCYLTSDSDEELIAKLNAMFKLQMISEVKLQHLFHKKKGENPEHGSAIECRTKLAWQDHSCSMA